MAEYDEGRLTQMMDAVGAKAAEAAGLDWDTMPTFNRSAFKQELLPVALALFEFVDTNPNEKVLALKQAIQWTLLEYNGVLPDQEQGVLEAWNAAFPEHPLNLDPEQEYEL